MGLNLVISIIALAGGTLQAITGFGGGIFIMIFLPGLISMNLAPAVSGTICTPLAWSIAFRYRKWCNLRKIFLPAVFYMAASTVAIKFTTMIDMNRFKIVFGGFLIILAIYFMFFDSKVRIKGSLMTMAVCSLVSGAFGGLFGIGGPMMVLYFLTVTDSKEEYLGTINGLFACTTLYQLVARIVAGIITWDSVPMIAFGTVGILLGRILGSRVVDKIDGAKMKKAIYAFLAFSGVLTVINAL